MKPINRPWEQLKKASSLIEKMGRSSSLEEYEDNWKEFLHRLERAWNKLVSHLNKSPKFQGWNRRGKVETLRKQDELLSYLKNARGVDEHSVEDITQRKSGGFEVNPAEGNTLSLKSLLIDSGNISIESDGPVKVHFFPRKVELVPVMNRGRTYQVPTSHLGIKLNSADPVELAKLAVEFYSNYFDEAESHFVK